jgi:hypothetical protein
VTLIFWLPLICVVLHVFEEFAWPGGFSRWYAELLPETGISFTPTYAVVINGLFVLSAVVLGLLGPEWSRGVSLWLALAALGASNSLFHLFGVLRLRRYSPGVITGVLLFMPLCIWGVWFFLSNGSATPKIVLTSLAIGSFFNLWAIFRHRGRASAISQRV